MDRGTPEPAPAQRHAVPGRVPLAVAVVDRAGLVTHWSSGARKLFGHPREEAVGRPAADLMPIAGALRSLAGADHDSGRVPPFTEPLPGQDGRLPVPAVDDVSADLVDGLAPGPGWPGAGRARCTRPEHGPLDVLWWSYPLAGPGPERLLVLAADAERLRAGSGAAAGADGLTPAFAPHTDLPGGEELAERLSDVLPGMGPAAAGRIVSQILELGYPVLEISQRERVPVTHDWGLPRHAARRRTPRPYAGAGEAAALPPEPEEAPDLEHAAVRERLEFLNEVSSGIGTSLDLERTIREVTSAAVPRFTDFAGTHLRAAVLAGEGFPDGPPDVTTVWHRVWVEHNDEPGRWDDTVPVGEAIAFPERTPFFQCMVTGEPVLIPHISEELGNRISGQFEKRDLRPLINGRSMLVVPLKARNVVLGFMVLMRRPGREPFNDMDRTTGAELAARAGLVLDNARMYTYQENVADTLQDSMLPQLAPHMAGCDTATRYLPGTRLGRVGGDWFDCVKLPGSRTAFVVGDVMGHGLNSAAMMGQLRTAVQTMAALDLPPEQLLRNLDDLAQRLGEHYLATCVYAVYDPIRGELRIANAGHIPPVLVRAEDGRSELLDLPTGAPIGVGGVPFETATVPVSPGDRLVLCTDGLVEVRGQDIGTGLAALCESAAHPAASMNDACDTIIRALNPRGGRKDDVALLMARLNGIPPRHVAHWRLERTPAEVRRARTLVRDRLAAWGLHSASENAVLCVSELVTNAVRHTDSRQLQLRLVRTDVLLCEVTDEEHTLPTLLGTALDKESGRGLRVVGALAREWGASHGRQGKTVWCELPLARTVRPRSNTG
ncbi:SpoIIE family protein phosphatase [Streptomyces gamaensis]|uniref:SpoIIE family protein phosphatase n=1 Tax=Streptomyces gamaensis TaxID=1763542 RepID=A0ABW0YY04_9ACTN